MSTIDWKHLEQTIASMTPPQLRRLIDRLRERLRKDQNSDLEAQRRAIVRLHAKLERVKEEDRFPDRGNTDRDHDSLMYDGEGQ